MAVHFEDSLFKCLCFLAHDTTLILEYLLFWLWLSPMKHEYLKQDSNPRSLSLQGPSGISVEYLA